MAVRASAPAASPIQPAAPHRSRASSSSSTPLITSIPRMAYAKSWGSHDFTRLARLGLTGVLVLLPRNCCILANRNVRAVTAPTSPAFSGWSKKDVRNPCPASHRADRTDHIAARSNRRLMMRSAAARFVRCIHSVMNRDCSQRSITSTPAVPSHARAGRNTWGVRSEGVPALPALESQAWTSPPHNTPTRPIASSVAGM